MKKQNPAVLYGLIGGAVLIVIGLVLQMYVTSAMQKAVESGEAFSPFKFLGIGILSFLLIIAIFVIGVVKTMKDYRKFNPDYTYKKLVGQGLLATLIIVVVSTGFSLLYSQVIDPAARQKTVDLTIQLYENIKMPEDQKEKAIEALKNQDPVSQTMKSLALTLFFGLILSLITAAILNKKGKEFPDNPNNLS